MIKTKLTLNFGMPDVVETYYKFWLDNPDILKSTIDSGFCVAAIGGSVTDMKDVFVIFF